MILLNTNVVSAVMRRRPDPAVVVVLELRYGVGSSPIDHRNDSGAHCTARWARCSAGHPIGAQRKTQGRSMDLRDTLIAGIAMANEAQLATRNVGHFSDTSICLINPFATDPHSG